jgi:hypothetical protein
VAGVARHSVVALGGVQGTRLSAHPLHLEAQACAATGCDVVHNRGYRTETRLARQHVEPSRGAYPVEPTVATGDRRDSGGAHNHPRRTTVTTRSLYDYVPHHHTKEKLDHVARPIKVSEQLPHGNPVARFNSWFAVKVTNGVGTMWCAYAFAALALVSLPAAVSSHNAVTLVSWVSQTFLQLVLLSVIIVGQNVLATAADKRADATYNDADAVLHEVVKLQEHLAVQDEVLQQLLGERAAS